MSGEPVDHGGTRRPDRPDVFASLASPTRREILHGLAHRVTATASELAEELPVSRQAIVKHLTLLGEAGLVTSQRVGREVRYRVAPEPLADVASWLVELGAVWDQRLERLSQLLAARTASSGEASADPGQDPPPDLPERPIEPPERPDEIPIPQRPDEIPTPQRPDEIPAPERPIEIPPPPRPSAPSHPEFPGPEVPPEVPPLPQ